MKVEIYERPQESPVSLIEDTNIRLYYNNQWISFKDGEFIIKRDSLNKPGQKISDKGLAKIHQFIAKGCRSKKLSNKQIIDYLIIKILSDLDMHTNEHAVLNEAINRLRPTTLAPCGFHRCKYLNTEGCRVKGLGISGITYCPKYKV